MVMLNNVNASDKRRSESGNVLFLILIAVALFAALSYAVTQSTRSGGGDASSETNLVNSSQITQYPASLKTAITRMNVSNSIAVDELLFDDPSLFSALSATEQTQAVFHPLGGGATYQQAPKNVMNGAASPVWIFNSTNEVKNIGTDAGTASRDIVAFLPDIKKAICDKINSQLGIGTSILEPTAIDYTTLMAKGTTGIVAAASAKIIGSAAGSISLEGKPQGCFAIGAGPTYVYYSVLIER